MARLSRCSRPFRTRWRGIRSSRKRRCLLRRRGWAAAMCRWCSRPIRADVYLLAQSDRLGTAYVVAGAILARYQALGGPAGELGYPASDASAGGTQLFANGAALGGSPVRLVTARSWPNGRCPGMRAARPACRWRRLRRFPRWAPIPGSSRLSSKGVIYGASAGRGRGRLTW